MSHHPKADCDNCPLYDKTGKNFCPSDGPDQADVIVLGDIPGRKDPRAGKPFSGMTGEVLDHVLKDAQIARSDVFLTNVVLCRPPVVGEPETAAVAACAPRLQAEVEARAPRHIISLGNPATKAALGKNKVAITKERVGPPKNSERFTGVKVIPTFHPAAALRNQNWFKDIYVDVRKLSVSSSVEWVPPEYIVLNNPLQAGIAIRQIHQATDTIVIDLETGFEKDDDFTHPNRILCAGVGYASGRVAVFTEEALRSTQVRQDFRELLLAKKVVCHNGKFDLGVLYKLGYGVVPLAGDTMLQSYILDERPGHHGLGILGQELLGTPDWKSMVDHKGIEHTPKDVLYQYNAFDVASTWDLWELFSSKMTDAQHKLHRMLCEISDTLTIIEDRGIKIDEAYQAEIDIKLSQEMAELRTEMADRGWVQNPNSWQQIQDALLLLGISTPSTDKEHMAAIKEMAITNKTKNKLHIKIRSKKKYPEVIEFLDTLAPYKTMAKLHGTYVKGNRVRMKKGRIHSSFTLHSTTTGRSSSRNPNIQNIARPRANEVNLRKMFIPDEGMVFVQVDYSGAELRVVCCLSGDENMAEILRDPSRDFMSEVAHAFFGRGFTKEDRNKAKTVVHGVNYGRTRIGLSRGMGITETEAQKYIDRYFARFPKLLDWQKSIFHTVFKTQEHLTTPFGRQRRIELVTPANQEELLKEALAFKPQSIASDINLSAMVKVAKLGYEVVVPVHDSIMVQVPIGEEEATAKVMMRLMTETAAEYYDFIPFPTDAECGDSWGNLKGMFND